MLKNIWYVVHQVKVEVESLAEKPSKWRFQGLKESKLFKGKGRKTGKPSSCPIKINQEILAWLKDSRLQISVLDLENSPNLKLNLKILKQAEGSFKGSLNVTGFHNKDTPKSSKRLMNI